MRRNLFRRSISLLIFLYVLINVPQKIFAVTCETAPPCNAGLGGLNNPCCYSDCHWDVCNSASLDCVCNSGYVCQPPSDPNDPNPNYRCEQSCGRIGESCCMTGDECATGLACHNVMGVHKCRECGVENGPCCVVGDPCNDGLDVDGTPGNHDCTCKSPIQPPVSCGTAGYPCCLEDGNGTVIGACNSGDSPCTCSEGVCKDGAGTINIFYSTHCFVAQDCGDEGQQCCAAPDPPCKGSPLICQHGSCCVDEDADGVCDGSSVPRPFGLLYTGPIITSLEQILGPVTKMLYYGGLAIGVFFIILSGYRIMTSEGDPQRTKAAQEQLTAAIMGIIFILLSVTILRVIINQILGESI